MTTSASRTFLILIVFAFVTRPALAAPGAATLLSPSGDVAGSTIAFSWQGVPGATWYLFWLGSATAQVHELWYTADQARCPAGGTCTITLTPPLVAGGYIWYIRTWDGTYGPWSDAKAFTFKDATPTWSRSLPDSRRFTLQLNDEAVLDNETGLTWQRTPAEATSWVNALGTCIGLVTAGRHGWRLATFSELSTLGMDGQNPPLPTGHPFVLGATTASFWSQTIYADTINILTIHFVGSSLIFTQQAKTDSYRPWCVRAATGSQR